MMVKETLIFSIPFWSFSLVYFPSFCLMMFVSWNRRRKRSKRCGDVVESERRTNSVRMNIVSNSFYIHLRREEEERWAKEREEKEREREGLVHFVSFACLPACLSLFFSFSLLSLCRRVYRSIYHLMINIDRDIQSSHLFQMVNLNRNRKLCVEIFVFRSRFKDSNSL